MEGSRCLAVACGSPVGVSLDLWCSLDQVAGAVLHRQRRAKSWTLAVVGDSYGVSRSTVHRHEKGDRAWTLADLVRYGEICGLSLSRMAAEIELAAEALRREGVIVVVDRGQAPEGVPLSIEQIAGVVWREGADDAT